MSDLVEATRAVRAAKAVAPRLPVMATMTFERTPRGFFTVMGVSVERAVAGLAAAGADVVGSNCGTGIEDMLEVARAMAKATALPIAIQPNAGLPVSRDGALVYERDARDDGRARAGAARGGRRDRRRLLRHDARPHAGDPALRGRLAVGAGVGSSRGSPMHRGGAASVRAVPTVHKWLTPSERA